MNHVEDTSLTIELLTKSFTQSIIGILLLKMTKKKFKPMKIVSGWANW